MRSVFCFLGLIALVFFVVGCAMIEPGPPECPLKNVVKTPPSATISGEITVVVSPPESGKEAPAVAEVPAEEPVAVTEGAPETPVAEEVVQEQPAEEETPAATEEEAPVEEQAPLTEEVAEQPAAEETPVVEEAPPAEPEPAATEETPAVQEPVSVSATELVLYEDDWVQVSHDSETCEGCETEGDWHECGLEFKVAKIPQTCRVCGKPTSEHGEYFIFAGHNDWLERVIVRVGDLLDTKGTRDNPDTEGVILEGCQRFTYAHRCTSTTPRQQYNWARIGRATSRTHHPDVCLELNFVTGQEEPEVTKVPCTCQRCMERKNK